MHLRQIVQQPRAENLPIWVFYPGCQKCPGRRRLDQAKSESGSQARWPELPVRRLPTNCGKGRILALNSAPADFRDISMNSDRLRMRNVCYIQPMSISILMSLFPYFLLSNYSKIPCCCIMLLHTPEISDIREYHYFLISLSSPILNSLTCSCLQNHICIYPSSRSLSEILCGFHLRKNSSSRHWRSWTAWSIRRRLQFLLWCLGTAEQMGEKEQSTRISRVNITYIHLWSRI